MFDAINFVAICNELPQIVNGNINYFPSGRPIRPDTEATYTCDSGYRLIGTQVRICEQITAGTVDRAEWSNDEPRCEARKSNPGPSFRLCLYAD